MKRILMMGVCLFSLTIISFFGRPSWATVNTAREQSEDSALSTHGFNVLKILTVLDNRMTDRPILEKMKDKVFSLSDRQVQLIASLSDQTVKERNSISGDITFLLLAALIIFL